MAVNFAVLTTFGSRDGVSSTFKRMGQSAARFGNKSVGAFGRASRASTGFMDVMKGFLAAGFIQRGLQALKDGFGGLVGQGKKIENATKAFTPLMGGAEKAAELVARLNKEAATTPFQFEGISKVAGQLLPVMNRDINATADTFRMLGDTAGGNIGKLESITRGYTKALLKGKPDMEALNMIAEAGVPIFSEMAKSMGVTQNQLFELSKKGKLTNTDLTNAFKMMTSEGGLFFKGMEIASTSLDGMTSTLKDNLALIAGTLSQTLFPAMKSIIKKGIELAGTFRELITANKEIIASKVDTVIQKIKNIIKISIPIIKKIFFATVDFVKAVFNLGKVIVSLFIPAQKKSNDSLTTLSDIIVIVVNTATSLVNIIAILIQKNKALSLVISNLMGVIKLLGAALALINFIINPTEKNFSLLKTRLQSLFVWFQNLGNAMVQTWDKIKGWAVLMSGPLLPLIILIDVLKNIIIRFNEIKQAFTEGGFVEGLKSIGSAILDGIIDPLKAAFSKLLEIKNALNPILIPIKNFFMMIGDIIYNNTIKIIDQVLGKITALKNKASGIVGKVKGFFTGGNEEQIASIPAPNRREVEARQSMAFRGRLDIAGAPEGSKVKTDPSSSAPVDVNLLGVNP